MTSTAPAARPSEPPRDLAARLFRVLCPQFGLRAAGDLHVAVPVTPWYAGSSQGDLACQISAAASRRLDRDPCDPPCRPRAGST